jgi:hypothetical protein
MRRNKVYIIKGIFNHETRAKKIKNPINFIKHEVTKLKSTYSIKIILLSTRKVITNGGEQNT